MFLLAKIRMGILITMGRAKKIYACKPHKNAPHFCEAPPTWCGNSGIRGLLYRCHLLWRLDYFELSCEEIQPFLRHEDFYNRERFVVVAIY